MEERVSPKFDLYRLAYGARAPNLEERKYEDETDDLSDRPDVFSVGMAPSASATVGMPPDRPRSSGISMHIWLVTPSDVIAALEEGESGKTTRRQRLAHTNLVGGKQAHAGGELWFKDGASIWLTGGSGRYPPKSNAELGEIVEAYRASGYTVCSCGWDEGNDGPARFFRGSEVWLERFGNDR